MGAHILAQRDHRPWPTPTRPWAVRQGWRDVLFLHWRVPEGAVAASLPPGLEVERCDGFGWVSIVAFGMDPVRWRGVVPVSGPFPEVNVRTYVTDGTKSGVWFYSLDATDRFFVWSAKRSGVAYRRSRMAMAPGRFQSDHRGETLDVAWTTGGAVQPDPLDLFLTERYCMYGTRGGRLLRGEVHHPPWPLHEASVTHVAGTLGHEWHGGRPPDRVHASPGVDVVAWRPKGC